MPLAEGVGIQNSGRPVQVTAIVESVLHGNVWNPVPNNLETIFNQRPMGNAVAV